MCKYCKRLEELRKQDRKQSDRTIEAWRRHAYKCDKAMQDALKVIQQLLKDEDVSYELLCDAELCVPVLEDLIDIDNVY